MKTLGDTLEKALIVIGCTCSTATLFGGLLYGLVCVVHAMWRVT
jgi:hypothetical protein